VPLKSINYGTYSAWLSGLAVDGSQKGTGLSASRITQAHQVVGAVLKYAMRTGKIPKTLRWRSSGPKTNHSRPSANGVTYLTLSC
jgi:hypothetical protein